MARGPNTKTPIEQRQNPSRRLVADVLPVPLAFGAKLSSKTPTKMAYLIQKGTASDEVKQMVQQCTGIPLKVYPAKSRKCNICSIRQTNWYCILCKRWVCMERRDKKRNKQKFHTYSHLVKGELLHFHKCCYHNSHETVWKKRFGWDKENLGF